MQLGRKLLMMVIKSAFPSKSLLKLIEKKLGKAIRKV